tara:strand:- start:54 stop:431 length:378 start_codon:yes stop_codon:yes gene_type:complete
MVPKDLKYTKEHEWVKIDGNEAVVGITDYAQSELGDIVFVEMPNIGDEFNQDDTLGTIEAVKTVADIFSPIKGTVSAVNTDIEDTPEYVNSDPYGKGWLIKIKFDNKDNSLSKLLSSEDYKNIIS